MTARTRMGWPPDDAGPGRFDQPRHVLDLVIYQMRLIEGMSAVEMTRMCEGEFGITKREWRFMANLAALGPMSPSALADYAGLDRARASSAITSLTRKGLVDRRSEPTDHRRATVALSQAGWALYQQTFPRLVAINQRLLSVLDRDDVAALERIMGLLGRQLVAMLDTGEPGIIADRKHGGSRRQWERLQRRPKATSSRDG